MTDRINACSRFLCPLGVAAFMLVVPVGCDTSDGPAETAGEKVDQAVEEAGDTADDMMDDAADAVEDAADEVGDAMNP